MNTNNIILFDFETGSIDPHTCEVTQIAAQVYDPRSLSPIDGATFVTYVKPDDFDNLDPKSLEMTNITVEMLEKAPDLKSTFKEFTDFIKKYKNGKSQFDSPIAAGHNIINFDLIIFKRLCQKFKMNKKNSDENTFFNKRFVLDTINILFLWFENNPEFERYNLDYTREFTGAARNTKYGRAHDALNDIIYNGDLLMKFLKLHRNVAPKIKFRDSMCGG